MMRFYFFLFDFAPRGSNSVFLLPNSNQKKKTPKRQPINAIDMTHPANDTNQRVCTSFPGLRAEIEAFVYKCVEFLT